MSAINNTNPHCLLIYTDIEDQTFNDAHLKEHEVFLKQVYTVDTIRTGTLDYAYREASRLNKRYHVIELAAHGGPNGMDLGDERIVVNGPQKETLKKLINMIVDHGVIILQSCRTGAPRSRAHCFAEYVAHLAERTVRVIANTGHQFRFEFRSLYPVSVRFIHKNSDQTACFQKRPDGQVQQIDMELLDHL